jgi:hypothetical protein
MAHSNLLEARPNGCITAKLAKVGRHVDRCEPTFYRQPAKFFAQPAKFFTQQDVGACYAST